MRLEHRKERQPSFLAKDWKTYIELTQRQMAAEVKVYNKATIEILSIANVKTKDYNQTVSLFMIQGENQQLITAQ